MCDYIGNDFGAAYPDACCIDGYLWDMDSGGFSDGNVSYSDDEAPYYDVGGDIPCRQCNTKKWVVYVSENVENDGYKSLNRSLTTKMVKNRFRTAPSNIRRLLNRHWRKGRKEAINDAMKEGN